MSEADRATFVAGLESLRKVPTAITVYIGRPAVTPPRPVIDQSYSYALHIVFDDITAHDTYQVHPIHLTFVEGNKTKWARVQIYDAL